MVKEYRLNGPLSDGDRLSACIIPGVMGLLAALCILMDEPWPVTVILLMVGAAAGFLFGRLRLIVDENGVQVRELFSAMRLLPWADVRTAAIACMGQYRMIVLSCGEPEQVLTLQHIRAGSTPGQEHRIPYTGERVQAIEHYLCMRLPEISL